MNFKKGLIYKGLLSVLAFAAVTSINAAGFWQTWQKPFSSPGQQIDTVVITGNYSKSRLLAELIQNYNNQPIILLPADENGKIFFVPPQKRGSALQIPFSEYGNFIKFLNAKQVLILGDSSYVPDKYVDSIPENQTVSRLKGKDWYHIADTAGRFLNLPNVGPRYKELLDKLLSDMNYKRNLLQEKPADTQLDVVATKESTTETITQETQADSSALVEAKTEDIPAKKEIDASMK